MILQLQTHPSVSVEETELRGQGPGCPLPTEPGHLAHPHNREAEPARQGAAGTPLPATKGSAQGSSHQGSLSDPTSSQTCSSSLPWAHPPASARNALQPEQAPAGRCLLIHWVSSHATLPARRSDVVGQTDVAPTPWGFHCGGGGGRPRGHELLTLL